MSHIKLKILGLILALVFLAMTGCQTEAPETSANTRVEISVVSSFGGEDGHRKAYEEAIRAYEAASGNVIKDASATADEEWKAKVMSDFEAGAEPDVLFYFTGTDSNKLVKSGKVVPIEEIRSKYPDYAANINEDLLKPSPIDGKHYGVPVSAYVEVMFVNKRVLENCGVPIPGFDYTWEQFLSDCAVIDENGYIPIACSLQKEPHYWFEFAVYNRGNAKNHFDLPKSSKDETGRKWVAALNDIKELYELGYFPNNTNTSTESEANRLILDDKAAFMANGSWRIGWFQENLPYDTDKIAVTFFPGNENRYASDIIGGFSMGYFITRKAWDNPEKQAACIGFVKSMTTDENMRNFSSFSANALMEKAPAPYTATGLEKSLTLAANSATSITGAMQDTLDQSVRSSLFSSIPNIITGNVTAEEALDAALALWNGNNAEE